MNNLKRHILISRKKTRLFTFLIANLIISNFCFGQSWSLQTCIDTALQNNFSLQSKRIQTQISDVNLKDSKQNLLPNLNGGVSHGYNWGQTIDLFTNQFASNRVMFDNFYLNSSITLFSGLRNYYTIKAHEIALQSGQLDLEIAKRNVRIDVSAAFLQVLLNKEILKNFKENYSQTQEQYNRITILVEENQATEAQPLEIDAQLQTDKYNIVKAENDLHYSELLLQQLMNIPIQDSIQLENTSEKIIIDNNNQLVVSKFPEINKQNLIIHKQTYEIQALKGRYYPSIDLSGSLGSGYSGNSKIIDGNGNIVPSPFREQFRNNLYESVILTLSIPIFNKNGTKNQIKIGELELKNLEVEKNEIEQDLQKKLEQLLIEIKNLNVQIEALDKVVYSANKNFKNFQIRYENGDTTYINYLEAQNKLYNAKSDFIQAKYQLKFKRLILGIYEDN